MQVLNIFKSKENSAMKTLKILLVLAAVILSGFSRNSQKTEKGVTVPFKFDGIIITNPSAGYTICTPPADPSKNIPLIAHARTGWLQGHQSHGGQLITEKSTYTIISCNTNFTTGTNTAMIEGVNTVANGDTYTYTSRMEVNIGSKDLILFITLTGGTGRFEGATGYATLTGVHVEGGIPVSGWGFLTFPK